MSELQEAELDKTRDVLDRLIAVEEQLTWTQNGACSWPAACSVLRGPCSASAQFGACAATDHYYSEALNRFLDIIKQRLYGGNGVDESHLQIVASTLAYFKVASKRIIDSVPMHIAHSLLQGTAKQLQLLPTQLLDPASGTDLLAELMVEEKTTVAQRRSKLSAQRDALANARRILSA